jgi:hypothetical protein
VAIDLPVTLKFNVPRPVITGTRTWNGGLPVNPGVPWVASEIVWPNPFHFGIEIKENLDLQIQFELKNKKKERKMENCISCK